MDASVQQLLLAALAGALLGGFYFFLLWFTLRKLAYMRHPALWLMLGLILRMAVLLAGLYWVTEAQWLRLTVALAALILVRMLLTRILGPQARMNDKLGYGKG